MQEAAEAEEEPPVPPGINILALAEELEFPLVEVYQSLSTVLPEPAPKPLEEDISTTYTKVKNTLKLRTLYKEKETIDRGLMVCLLLLVDKSMKSGEGDPIEFVVEAQKLIPDEQELKPVKHMCVILLAQLYMTDHEEEAESVVHVLGEVIAELEKATGTRRQPLLHAAALNVLMSAFAYLQRTEDQNKHRETYESLLKGMTKAQRRAIGVGSVDSAMEKLREKVGDVL